MTSIFPFYDFYSSFLVIIAFGLISLASAKIFFLLTSILSSPHGQAEKVNLQPNPALTSSDCPGFKRLISFALYFSSWTLFILTTSFSPDRLTFSYLAK